MPKLKKSFLLGVFLFSVSAAAKPSDIYLCETYRVVNTAKQCSSDNYLIRFGYKYCRKYVLLEDTYQPQTQKVLAKIRSCLVTELLNDTKLTCANSEERAMDQHLKCYIRAGFCGLPFIEKAKIFKAAWTETRHESFRRTMIKVKSLCDNQN